MSEFVDLTLGEPKTVAEMGSDPNSGSYLPTSHQRNTELGSDPISAGQPTGCRVEPGMTGSTSPLWQRIQSSGIKTLAVMGMTKNTGKTVALNHLLAQAHGAQVAVGVTSIGRDGEDRDAVFFVPKPPVRVWPGNLVVTARSTLQRAKVRTKLIDTTGIDSPMGEIVLVKVLAQGDMEIAGASRSSDQQQVIARLQQCGAALVLLDGALGRSHHASPAVADGVILATGAAIGGGMADVLRKTRDRLAILGIGQADVATRALCQTVFDSGGVALWNAQGECLMHANISTLNSAAALMQYAQADIQTIAVSGAVGRALWQALMTLASSHPGLTLVVQDGTRLFVEAADLAALTQLGGQVLAYRGIQITGITLNPFSPHGGSFDANAFLRAAQQALPGYTVTDVMLEDAQTLADLGSDYRRTDSASARKNCIPGGTLTPILRNERSIAESGSDPNSGYKSKSPPQRSTELGSDPHSAGQTNHAS